MIFSAQAHSASCCDGGAQSAPTHPTLPHFRRSSSRALPVGVVPHGTSGNHHALRMAIPEPGAHATGLPARRGLIGLAQNSPLRARWCLDADLASQSPNGDFDRPEDVPPVLAAEGVPWAELHTGYTTTSMIFGSFVSRVVSGVVSSLEQQSSGARKLQFRERKTAFCACVPSILSMWTLL